MLAVVLLMLLAGSTTTTTTTSAQTVDVAIGDVKLVNKLSERLTVLFLAPVLGSEQSTVIPPGECRALPQVVQGPVRRALCYQVDTTVYHTSGSVLETAVPRAISATGTVTISITSYCYEGNHGLSFVSTALGQQLYEGCAVVDVDGVCPPRLRMLASTLLFADRLEGG